MNFYLRIKSQYYTLYWTTLEGSKDLDNRVLVLGFLTRSTQ